MQKNHNPINTQRLLTESSVFCILPWIHLHVNTLGIMSCCCVAENDSERYGFGNVNDHSLKELWQGEAIRALRIKFLTEQKDMRCEYCYIFEYDGLESYRTKLNKKYGAYAAWVESTDANTGFAPDARPIFWDIRFSNKCNLKCRICSHRHSSAWFRDSQHLSNIQKIPLAAEVEGVDDADGFMEQLEPFFPDVKEVYCAGGEPLIIDATYRLLQKLLQACRNDIELVFNTNLTTLTYKHYDITSLWSQFTDTTVFASIDDSEKRVQYLRHGLQWQRIIENQKRLRARCPSIKFYLNPTVCIFNVLYLPQLHKTWVEQGLIQVSEISFNILQYPEYLSIQILPVTLKKIVSDALHQHICWIRDNSSSLSYTEQESLITKWDDIIVFLNAQDSSSKVTEFFAQTAALDVLRNESFSREFPELQGLYDFEPDTVTPVERLGSEEKTELRVPCVQEEYYIKKARSFLITAAPSTVAVEKAVTLGIGHGKDNVPLTGTITFDTATIVLSGWYQQVHIPKTSPCQSVAFTITTDYNRHISLTWWHCVSVNSQYSVPRSQDDVSDCIVLNPLAIPLNVHVMPRQNCVIPFALLPDTWKPGSLVVQIAPVDNLEKQLDGTLSYQGTNVSLSGWYQDISIPFPSSAVDLKLQLNLSCSRSLSIVWWGKL